MLGSASNFTCTRCLNSTYIACVTSYPLSLLSHSLLYRPWTLSLLSQGAAEDADVQARLSIYLSESHQALSRLLRSVPNLAHVDTAPITMGWANATVDNNHFDGGVLREMHGADAKTVREQPVSRNLLNVLLNCMLAREAA